MNGNENPDLQMVQAGYLRREAEQRVQNRNAAPVDSMAEVDVRAMLHELQVHQIELELQNAELLRTHLHITERKELESEVFRICDAERHRLALDLHDGICQELIAIAFSAKAIERQLDKQGHPLAANMQAVAIAISQAAAHVRRIAHGMAPVATCADGLSDALRALARETADKHQLCCHFASDLPVSVSDTAVSHHLYHIAREAVCNSATHSGATRIDLELSETRGKIQLVVRDNGCGLPLSSGNSPGFGLRGMKYRASLIDACLVIQNRAGGGTEVLCSVLNG